MLFCHYLKWFVLASRLLFWSSFLTVVPTLTFQEWTHSMSQFSCKYSKCCQRLQQHKVKHAEWDYTHILLHLGRALCQPSQRRWNPVQIVLQHASLATATTTSQSSQILFSSKFVINFCVTYVATKCCFTLLWFFCLFILAFAIAFINIYVNFKYLV